MHYIYGLSQAQVQQVILVHWDCLHRQVHREHTLPDGKVTVLLVPNSKSRNIPEIVIVRRGAGGGSGNLGRVGQLGEGRGKQGQFTSDLRGRWTIPVTTGGCQVSRRGHKGDTKGCKREPTRGEKSKGECAMYICNCIVCATE
jgi:hypothetical protein